ncbi:MAG: MlaD family protein [Melioribacteraceae bacterium]|nr:MlaD family protein [Melioribacteraceae bacterium]MCF8352933.1 MlaD family protein [Melioribacteraceae bacterium]MCF8395869.1 MlaD family protein [Melioribacteraceae bacterium]MCF8417450.1 MlaD family protein [Melioribacteraceae bacterium]
MDNRKKAEIKVGVTVFIGLIIFLWVFGWAKNIDLGGDKKILQLRFDNVAGLYSGDAVTINGVKKGYVDKIYVDKNSAIVEAVVDQDTDLRSDATFSIMMLDLMGGKKIEINPGDHQTEIDFSAIHHGEFVGDISTAMAMLSSVQNDLVTVIKDASSTLKGMNEILSDDKFIFQLKSSVANMNNLMIKLNSVIDENKSGINSLITESNRLTSNLNSILDTNKTAVNDLLVQVNKAVANSNELINKVNLLFDETKSQKNNLGKALYNDELFNELSTTLETVNKMMKILIDQLEGEGVNVDASIF